MTGSLRPPNVMPPGDNRGPKFIAEISSNHNQDLSRALALVDAAADSGFDAVKFQLFEIDKLFAPEILEASADHRARKNWELPREFVPHLAERARSRGLEFSCTPFDLDALAFIDEYVDFIKIASYELLWLDLIRAAGATGKPVIISTGMATLDEVQEAVVALRESGCRDITVLHCVSEYPAKIENCGLATIETLRETFGEKVGWSDHSSEEAVILAAALRWRSDMIEVHFDLDGRGDEFGPGHCWLPSIIEALIRTIRSTQTASGLPDKRPVLAEMPERDWRADSDDGLRPLRQIRSSNFLNH